jgi:Uma2 family endonuclease
MTAATTQMTAEEFTAWGEQPENESRWFELVRGSIIKWPTPYRVHGVVAANAGIILSDYTRLGGQGYVCQLAGFIARRSPDTVRAPDVAFYQDGRNFDELPVGYDEVAPVLAVEVLSPDDPAAWMLDKINDYLSCGVRMVWVLEPTSRSITVFQPNAPLYRLDATQWLTGGDVLPGFRSRVETFFQLPAELARKPDTP